jgi:hypothetical protein
MRKLFFLLLVLFFYDNAVGQVYTTASKVEILEGHTWYPGKIVEVKADQYKIHYDMYDDSWDIWIKKDRLRLATATVNPAQLKTMKPVTGMGKLYSGSSAIGGSVYYYMYPSGQIVLGCPVGGLESFNFNAFCTARSGTCGVYTRAGNAFTITWNSGNSVKGNLKPNGDIDINGSLIGEVKMVPNRLSANYEFTASLSGMSVAEVTSFKDDGTYEIKRVSGYDNNDGRNSAEWQSAQKGSYKINGYTITMTDQGGKVKKHTIYALDVSKSPDFLGWDGNFLAKGK